MITYIKKVVGVSLGMIAFTTDRVVRMNSLAATR